MGSAAEMLAARGLRVSMVQSAQGSLFRISGERAWS